MKRLLPLLLLLTGWFAPAVGSPVAKSSKVLPFIADDYPKALAQARARKLPIFVESWAPW